MDANSGELPVVGSVTNIAPGERIYAVRFLGARGYVVTFEKVDPLFVLDLSEPTNPILEGELVMPGYSTYLHPLGQDRLIGFGKDAEDAGTFSWFQGLKLATFDVSTAATPAIADEILIGSRGSDSLALSDHHAFTFDAEKGLLALPITLYEESNGGSDYGNYQYDGVHVYSITDDGQITPVAEIPTATDWNDVERTIFIGDENQTALYILDRDSLHLSKLDGTAAIDASVTLDQADEYDEIIMDNAD